MVPEISPALLKGAPLAASDTGLSSVLFCPTFSPSKLQGQKLWVPGAAGAARSPAGRGAPAPRRCLSRSRSLRPSRERGLGLSGPRWPRTPHGRARLGFNPSAPGGGSVAALGCKQRSWRDSGQ